MFLQMARDLIDPRTRQATAFYAATAVSVYDVIRHGFHFWNVLILASAAGLSAVGVLAMIVKTAKGKLPD